MFHGKLAGIQSVLHHPSASHRPLDTGYWGIEGKWVEHSDTCMLWKKIGSESEMKNENERRESSAFFEETKILEGKMRAEFETSSTAGGESFIKFELKRLSPVKKKKKRKKTSPNKKEINWSRNRRRRRRKQI